VNAPTAMIVTRAGVLLAAVAALTEAAWRLAEPALVSAVRGGTSGPGFDVTLRGLLAGALLAGWLWCALGVVMLAARLVAAAVRDSGALVLRDAGPRVPAALRRAVPAALGVAVTGALVVPAAVADPLGRPDPAAHRTAGLTGLGVPDRTPVRAAPSGGHDRAVVVVAPGDSLWAISRRLLRPGASDADVGRACGRLYAANVARVGPDPDRIYPGIPLRVPDLVDPRRPDRKEAS
jgi:nucleoid-associated protein YgaU